MKELRGGAVDRYLHCWTITASGARTLHVFLLLHHPQHLQFIMLDHESIKRRRRGEEKRKMQEEQEQIEKEIKPGHVEDMLIISICVCNVLLLLLLLSLFCTCCISYGSIK